jgi:hypothetical protein
MEQPGHVRGDGEFGIILKASITPSAGEKQL